MTSRYSINLKQKANSLRKEGYSINEISNQLKVNKSTIYYWVKKIYLNLIAQNRLQQRVIIGQKKALKRNKKKREILLKQLKQETINTISKIDINSNISRLICAIFFWTEGGKYTNVNVSFTNSDPIMIQTFLRLLRIAFNIKEQKFRVLVHIHEYHNEKEIIKYWSKITNIPLKQFNKCYLKSHTKKRIRKGYMGTVRIRYYDSKIALELRFLYNIFAQRLLHCQ
jgi:transposase